MLDFINTYVIGAALPLVLSAAGIFLGIYTGVWRPRTMLAGTRSLFAKRPAEKAAVRSRPCARCLSHWQERSASATS